jgi:putative membrane protein
MKILIKIIISTVSILVAAYLIPGVIVDALLTAVIVAIVLGVLNAFVRPVLVFLTLPINFITLGLFTFVINASLVYVTAMLVPGFELSTIWIALLFAVVTSLINSFLSMFLD